MGAVVPFIAAHALPLAAAGVLYGLGHLIGFFHGKRAEQKLNAAAKQALNAAGFQHPPLS